MAAVGFTSNEFAGSRRSSTDLHFARQYAPGRTVIHQEKNKVRSLAAELQAKAASPPTRSMTERSRALESSACGGCHAAPVASTNA